MIRRSIPWWQLSRTLPGPTWRACLVGLLAASCSTSDQQGAAGMTAAAGAAAQGSSGGGSSTDCAAGESLCNGTCVRLASDPSNCGQCGVTCQPGQGCVDGACVCPAGLLLCDGVCVDTSLDRNHCGGCGQACPSGTTCSGGVCTPDGGSGGAATGGNGSGGAATGGGGLGGAATGGDGAGGAATGGDGAGGTAAGGTGATTAGGTGGDGSGATTAGGTGGDGAGGSATGGSGGTGGQSTGGTTGDCGGINMYPLGCDFAWGAYDSGNRSSWLDFVATWVGDEPNGGLDGSCGDCALAQSIAAGSSMLVYYTYFIGFQAREAGYGDCNVDSDGQNLCSHGAAWIRQNWDRLVEMYGNYARMTYEASPSKPVIWWLEGDYVQYSYDEQTEPLSMAELGQLAREITCAIKSNEPNAVVAMNHSPWLADDLSEAFWSAMPMDVLDMVWVQGPGDSGTFVNSGDYNAATANYSWLHQKTGRTIMAETSFASSGQADRWSTTTASNINQRIAEGVIAVHVNDPASSYQSAIESLSPQLSSVCQ